MILFLMNNNGHTTLNTFCHEPRVLFRINRGNINQSQGSQTDEENPLQENQSTRNVIDVESKKIAKAIQAVQDGKQNESTENIIQKASLAKINNILQEQFTGNQNLTEKITNIHNGANTSQKINKSLIDDIATGRYKKLNNTLISTMIESPLSAVFQYLLHQDLREGYINALVQMNVKDKKVQKWAEKHGRMLQNIPNLSPKEKGRLTEFIDLCKKASANTLSKKIKTEQHEASHLPGKIINLLTRKTKLGEASAEKKILAKTKSILPPERYQALLKKIEQAENQDFASRIELYIATIDQYIRTMHKNNIQETQKKTEEYLAFLSNIPNIFPNASPDLKQSITSTCKIFSEHYTALFNSAKSHNRYHTAKISSDLSQEKEALGLDSYAFDEKDLEQIEKIEKRSPLLKKQIRQMGAFYKKAIARIELLDNGKQTPEEIHARLVQEKISLPIECVENFCSPKGANIPPSFFAYIRNFALKWNIEPRDLDTCIHSNASDIFPESVLASLLSTPPRPKVQQYYLESHSVFIAKHALENDLPNIGSKIIHTLQADGTLENKTLAESTADAYNDFLENEKENKNNILQDIEKTITLFESYELPPEEQSSGKRILSDAIDMYGGVKELVINQEAFNAQSFGKELKDWMKTSKLSHATNLRIIKMGLEHRPTSPSTIIYQTLKTHFENKTLVRKLSGLLDVEMFTTTPPPIPHLAENAWHTEQILIENLQKQQGVSQNAFLFWKKIITQKRANKQDIPFVQSFSEVQESSAKGAYYNKKTENIVLPDDQYNILLHDPWDPNNPRIIQVLIDLSHETFHGIAGDLKKNPYNTVLQTFNNTLKEKNTFEKYVSNLQEIVGADDINAQHIHGKSSKGIGILEEAYATMMGVMQSPNFEQEFSPERIAQRLQNEESLYGLNPSMQKLVYEIYTDLGKEVIQKTLEQYLNEQNKIFGSRDDIFANSKAKGNNNAENSDAQKYGLTQDQNLTEEDRAETNKMIEDALNESPENNKTKEEDEENARLSPSSRESKFQELQNSIKATKGYIAQLEEGKGNLPRNEKSKMDKWVRHFNQIFSVAEDEMIHRAETEKDATTIIKYVNDNALNKAKEFVYQVSSANEEGQGFLKTMWKNTDLLSMSDLGMLTTTTWEYIKRRFGTKQKQRVGRAGRQMANGMLNGLAGEFNKENINAENSEVGEVQGGLENKSDEEVLEFLREVSDPYSFQAVVQELSKRGLIDWGEKENKKQNSGDRIYIKKLKELGATVRFYDSDFISDVDPDSQTLLNSKLSKAFLQIYGDSGMFNKIYNENKGQLASRIKSAEDVAGLRGGVPAQLKEWLKLAHRGEYVPWHDYEGYISFMVGDGTTDPSEYIYYLMMGIDADILSIDAIQRFYGAHGNDFPPSNGMASWKKEDVKTHCKAVLPAGRSPWQGVPSSFNSWVHATVMTMGSTRERTTMNLGQKGLQFDHDNGHLLTSVGNAMAGAQFMTTDSTGKTSTKDTIYNQSILGMMTHLGSITIHEKEGNLKYDTFKKVLKEQAGYFASVDAIGNTRMEGAKGVYRFSTSFLQKPPRATNTYNEDMNTQDYLEMGRAIFSQGADEMFRRFCTEFVFNNALNSNPKKTVEKWNEFAQEPEIKAIFDGNPPSLEAYKNESEKRLASIFDKVFTHYLSKDENVRAISDAAYSVVNGKGIPGVENSTKWKYEALQSDDRKLHQDADKLKKLQTNTFDTSSLPVANDDMAYQRAA